MKNIGLFLIILSILSACPVSPAHAQQRIGIPPTLDQFHPSMVLKGDPDLISRFKDRVVIISCLSYVQFLKWGDPSSRAGRDFVKQQLERHKKI